MDDDNELQCPVCFEIPQNQVYQCLNGHTICGKCSASIIKCPQCRVDLKVNGELIRNRAVESLIARKLASLSLDTQGSSKTTAAVKTNATSSSASVSWNCPVCNKVPRKDIYQCQNGHSVCHLCVSKVQLCPTCKTSFGRVRNHSLENLLDSMSFPCDWKDQGCDVILPRRQPTEHESICKFRAARFCRIFAGFPNCDFLTKRSQLNDNEEFQRILNHLQTHNLVVTKNIPIGFPYNFSVYPDHFALPANRRVHYFKPQFLEVVNTGQVATLAPTNYLAILLQKVELDNRGQVIFSLGFVLLTAQSGEANSIVKVKLFIKGLPKHEIVEKFGKACVPDLCWTIKPMNDLEYREFLKKPASERPEFAFSLPVSHIQKFYADWNGCFTFSFTFQSD